MGVGFQVALRRDFGLGSSEHAGNPALFGRSTDVGKWPAESSPTFWTKQKLVSHSTFAIGSNNVIWAHRHFGKGGGRAYLRHKFVSCR